MPRSWRKWSVQNKLDARFHLRHDEDLSINYVNADGEAAFAFDRLRTCVQVWERTVTLRPRIDVADLGLIERCEPEEADVALTIFGYGCGTVRTEFPRSRNTTQMYLRLTHPRALEALQAAGELPAALLVDVEMPRMDGYDLAREIRRIEAARGSKKPIPIIACTANAMESDQVDRIVVAVGERDGAALHEAGECEAEADIRGDVKEAE